MLERNRKFASARIALILALILGLIGSAPQAVSASGSSQPVHDEPLSPLNLDPAGSLDNTFGSNGIALTPLGISSDEAWAVEIQPDGKILVAGETTNSASIDFFIARYNSIDGSLDSSFNFDGIVETDLGQNDVIQALTIQSDGKIIAAGFTYPAFGSDTQCAVARYNPDGSLDTSFDSDGKAIVNNSSGYDYCTSVIVQPDGKIVLAGTTNIDSTNDDILLARLTATGSLDSSFNANGIVTTTVSGIEYAHALELQPDGKIVVGGAVTTTTSAVGLLLLRYNTNGALDSFFDGDGIVISDFGASINENGGHVALQVDGKILLSGYDSSGYFLLSRYDNNGSPDMSFGSGGKVAEFFVDGPIAVEDISLQEDNKIVLAGYARPGFGVNTFDFALARFTSDGLLDDTFDTDGKVISVLGLHQFGKSVAIQSDGKIVVVGRYEYGTSNNDAIVARYLGDPVITGLTYVNWTATGANNGTSWENAYTDLQSALSAAVEGDEIWVATGNYTPTSGADRGASFILNNGVAIYGGFSGVEVDRAQRNPQVYITTLNGDIGVSNDPVDNSYHVVVGSNTNSTAVLDGFTITGGNADQSGAIAGGGMYNYNGSPTLRNILFENNHAVFGGGMYNDGEEFPDIPDSAGSNPILTDVIFRNNSATEGGGMRNTNYSDPILTRVVFEVNTAIRSGGGMENFNNSSPILTDVILVNNSALPEGAGGGMFNWIGNNPVMNNVTFSGNSAQWGGGLANYQSSPILTNVTFTGNSSSTFGGAISNEADSLPQFVNVTISENSAGTVGGGIYNDSSSSNAQIRNSILFDNNGGQIHNEVGTAAVTYSIVQGGYTGTGNIDADPLLGPLQNNGGRTPTMALAFGSPAIDAGDDSTCALTDQRGVIRSSESPCDLGAYEYVPHRGIRYVKWDASGANIGTSWADAFTDLQSALAAATGGDEIWVAAGTYEPTSNTDRNISFLLRNDIAVYGGFSGNETLRSQRDYVLNPTILSGDLGIPDNRNDNSSSVVKSINLNNTAILDGFTIKSGSAIATGGGMYNENSTPTLENLIFSGNFSGNLGGGMYNVNSSPSLVNLTFIGNSASQGGGMYNNNSSPSIQNVIFDSNTSANGGGMNNSSGSNPTLNEVIFINNSAIGAEASGGGMANQSSSPVLANVAFVSNSSIFGGGMSNRSNSGPLITNVTFSGNTATSGGGMTNFLNSNPIVVTNATFSGNSAIQSGGAISNSESSLIIRNTILYGNSGGQILSGGSLAPLVTYSIIAGGYPGTGNLNVNPLLGPLQNNGGFTQTMALQSGSPAIDTANDAFCPPTDQRGVTRPQGSHCDIGAYELEGSGPTPTFTPSLTLTPMHTATFTPTIVPSITHTSPPPTSTHTPTRTPKGAQTNTPTRTNTPITPTATHTVTPHPPTVTFTPSPTTIATNTPNSSAFPSTGVLDIFNRVNGEIGSNWSGFTTAFAISSKQLDVVSSGVNTSIFWKSTSFGSDQEVHVKLTQIESGTGNQYNLILKSQSNKNTSNGLIAVKYDTVGQIVQVGTFHPTQGWLTHGANVPVTFVNGDQFGARARADGTVEIYKNGVLIGTRSITSWPNYSSGGYVGLWMVNAPNAVLDDFGGGTVTP